MKKLIFLMILLSTNISLAGNLKVEDLNNAQMKLGEYGDAGQLSAEQYQEVMQKLEKIKEQRIAHQKKLDELMNEDE